MKMRNSSEWILGKWQQILQRTAETTRRWLGNPKLSGGILMVLSLISAIVTIGFISILLPMMLILVAMSAIMVGLKFRMVASQSPERAPIDVAPEHIYEARG